MTLGFFALIIISPATIVIPLGNLALSTQGIKLHNLEGLTIGLGSANLESGAFIFGENKIRFEDLSTTYSLTNLIYGKIETLEANKVHAELRGSFDNSTFDESLGWNRYLPQVKNFPINELNVIALNVVNENYSASGSLSITSELIDLNGEMTLNRLQDWRFNGSFSSDDLEKLTVTVSISSTADMQELSKSSATVEISDKKLSLIGSASIYPATLKSQLELAEFFTISSINNEQLQVDFSAELDAEDDFPYFESLDVQLNSLENQINLEMVAGSLSYNASIPTPVIYSAQKSDTNSYTIALSDFDFILELLETPSPIISSSMKDVQFSCESLNSCLVKGELHTTMEGAELIDGLEVGSAELSGEFSATFEDSSFRLNPSEFSLIVPTLRIAGIESRINLQASNSVLAFDNKLTASAQIKSNLFDISNENFRLINPVIYGTFGYENHQLEASLDVQINNLVDTAILLQHDHDSDTGSLEIELKPFKFGHLLQLNSLVSQSIFPAHLTQGEASAIATLEWQFTENQELVFSGPAQLKLEKLSGYLNETYFVGLSSEVNAFFTNPLGLISQDKIKATVAIIDPGIALEQVSWDYGFDTSTGNFILANLESEVLGGAIEIPEFNYDNNSKENRFNIVLNGLDLEEIVSLANYPNLKVDGLISGYLPLLIAGDSLIINEGLVSTLKPGGIIQYAPEEEFPDPNPSLKLLNEALSNYQYETMDTEIYYMENGDLRMEVQLAGVNPDMNGGQPINLNINITDNIPTLLKSLRASRIITDALEKEISGK